MRTLREEVVALAEAYILDKKLHGHSCNKELLSQEAGYNKHTLEAMSKHEPKLGTVSDILEHIGYKLVIVKNDPPVLHRSGFRLALVEDRAVSKVSAA